MDTPPYMPFYVSDYLGDTHHLSTIQHGMYLKLLLTMWNGGGSLEYDEERLRVYAGLSKANWNKNWPAIRNYFTVDEGRIFQKRLKKEYEVLLQKRKALSQNGKRGGRPKSLKNKDQAKANGFDLLKQPEPEPEPELSTDISSLRSEISGASPPSGPSEVTPESYVWTVGVELLTSSGDSEKAARSFIGKSLRQAGGAVALQRVIDAAIVANTGDPKPYIMAAINGRKAEASEVIPGRTITKRKSRISACGKFLEVVDKQTGEVLSRHAREDAA